MKKNLQFLSLIATTLFAGNAMAQRYVTNSFTNVTVTPNIVYGQNYSVLTGAPVMSDLKLDFYEPTGDTEMARPLVIVLHTGSFLPKGLNQSPTGARTDSSIVEMCKEFAKKGYVAAAVGYRAGWNPQGDQDVRTGTILNAVYRGMQDTKNAVRYFRYMGATSANTYKIDTNRIVLCGQGSGGYISLACGTLNKPSEILLLKFINQTTQMPYVIQQAVGDFDGFGGNPAYNNANNYPGYSSRVNMTTNYGGAMGDSSWLEAGEVPIVGMQGKLDPFAPYKTGGVYVPGTNPPLLVVEASGSYDVADRASRLGVNNVFKTPAFTDAYSTAAASNSNGLTALFSFNGAANGSAPWEWWDPTDPFNANGLASNPFMSKARALLYIDTIQNFMVPRIARVLFPSTGITNTFATEGNVSVYPNPAADILNVRVEGLNGAAYAIEMLDATGRIVRNEQNLTGQSYVVNRNELSNGVYYVKVTSGLNRKVAKVVLY